MMVGKHHLARMYVVTIALLLALAAIGAYQASAFPFALVTAVVSCILIELVVVKAKKHRYRIPLSAIITGLIIGSVAPINAPLLLIVAAALIAELAKFFIKAKGRNVFNPAALGLLIALAVFGAGDEWWAAPSIHAYGLLIPIGAVLVISAYEARRLPLALVAAAGISIGVAVLAGTGLSAAELLYSLLAVNYYFVFLMVADPKTSPNKMSGQAVYGIGIALIALLFVWGRVSYPLLLALVLANILYALFRVLHKGKAVAGTAAATSRFIGF